MYMVAVLAGLVAQLAVDSTKLQQLDGRIWVESCSWEYFFRFRLAGLEVWSGELRIEGFGD